MERLHLAIYGAADLSGKIQIALTGLCKSRPPSVADLYFYINA
jgi:hypothetical protein